MIMISIIVPVYCGANTITHLLPRIEGVFKRSLKNYRYEVIFVDDCSPDNSYDVIYELSRNNDNVLGFRLKNNVGQQNATYCGMHHAQGDIIVTLDDDLQHEPELIPVLLSKLSGDTKLVYGVFNERADGRHRKWGSKLTAQFFKQMFKNLGENRVSSFRLFTKSINERVIGQKYGFVYISCLLLSECGDVDNVVIPFTPRTNGRSNYNLVKLLKLFSKLYLNYGPLRKFYHGFVSENTPSFAIEKTTLETNEGDGVLENNDAWRRIKSTVCN